MKHAIDFTDPTMAAALMVFDDDVVEKIVDPIRGQDAFVTLFDKDRGRSFCLLTECSAGRGVKFQHD